MAKLRTGVTVAIFVFCIAIGVISIQNRQEIRDWLILRNYQPSAQIEALADRTSLTEKGEKLFYVHDPQLKGKDEFNSKCDVTEKSIILGCYDGIGIYIYDITDERLQGVEEVTAAHEMLHAAYDRLSNNKKKEIDAELQDFSKSITNPRILSLIESYKAKNEANLPNEMHSIFGTEVSTLTPKLEEYYSQYFTNRQRVVSYAETYEKVFTDIQDKVEQLDTDLLLRKAQIDSKEATLISESNNLRDWKERIDYLALQNRTADYLSQAEAYNVSVTAYNNHLKEVKNLIETYNQLVAQRNELALQQNSLIKSLDSKAMEIGQ